MSDLPSIAGLDLTKRIDLRPSTDPAQERAQIQTLAQEFEAMLMLQMIREMRKSMLDESASDQGLGGETMRDTFDIELSRHLAGAGGFGLGALLSGRIGASSEPARPASSELNPASPGLPLEAPAASVPVSSTPKALDVSANRQSTLNDGRHADTGSDDFRLSLPIKGATTSDFGWRSDPVTGRNRFHRGVDLRAAYGTDVPAAEAGQVVFAGERGAYGNLVIVRHDNGIETRYAHLSSIAVAPGATVAAGESLGRVGSTGRSTAPHLHFEVLVNGERVDPERVAARVGRGPLKLVSHADD